MRTSDFVDLPAPADAPTVTLGHALRTRRSTYEFAPLPADTLSTLLRWALGPGRTVRLPDGTNHVANLHPTAGGLPSLSTYVLALEAIDDIPAGIHVHDPARHGLRTRGVGDVRAATTACLVQPQFAERAPAIVVLVGELTPTLAKYGERHFRTLHVDAGIAAQNLYLVGTALDLACCAISGFHDDRLAALLELDGDQVPLLAFAVGARRDPGQDGQSMHTEPHPDHT